MDFGQGNIGIRITCDFDRSYLVFGEIEHKPIGNLETEDGAEMTILDLLDAPVLMSFSNIESIDALIFALKKARGCMEPIRTAERNDHGNEKCKGVCKSTN